ncbi:hypothetical protein [Brachybacterium sp.]|uniref:hypothetical protein n=1 Tax=Brachybacterium sp. TaxID=1891286 RepID=UPI002ED60E81
MPIDYDQRTGTVRGRAAEIETVHAALAAGDPSGGGALPQGDPILEALAQALGTTMLTLEVSNSGPGGHQQHLLAVGTNAVIVRRSRAGDALAELVGVPFQVLPGALTRLVNFLPGRAPAEDAAPVRLGAAQVTALASEDAEERAAAWPAVQDLLSGLVEADEAAASWQLVRVHSAWTATDGEPTEDLAVYLRAGEAYFVLVQEGEDLDLVPVPSITAWEAMMHVLPGHQEIKDPRG